jgi:hypothetical protein
MDTKAKIILDLLLSLNRGGCGTIADRPYYAIEQYERLVKKGIIVEESNTDKLSTSDVSELFCPSVGHL